LPELPEVETVVRSIRPYVLGRRILSAEVNSRRVTRGDHRVVEQALTGRKIIDVRRHGKQVFFELDSGVLYIHLGMTGKLLWNGVRTKYARAIVGFADGTLIYDDVRQFGRFEFYAELPEERRKVGPDALTVSFEEFLNRLKRHHGSIKTVLLNQSFIGGVGNIYADEALFAAAIHPKARADKLSKKRAQLLHEQVLAILKLAVLHRGSSISNYVDADGACGNYQQQHNVYGRAGEACPRCGKTIRRIVLGQRGTHYCPGCQHV
jgi:formamidopyrimidine-DNA glycosylase